MAYYPRGYGQPQDHVSHRTDNSRLYWPYNHDRDSRRYYDPALRNFREPSYVDDCRRNYPMRSSYDGRQGVVPLEEVFYRGGSPRWTNNQHQQYRGHPGGRLDGCRMDRYYDHFGRTDYGGYRNHQYHQEGSHLDRHLCNQRLSRMVQLYVPICCDKCVRKLRKLLQYEEGVESFTMDQTTKKVVVYGNVNQQRVLNLARQDKAESEFWECRQI
ncbi:uncharacterized protein [Physcomitrium patens]|uniref:HMA domain-containing protein n=1 Tax=Physcomitrium patens TaxID=3218 RepID=A0A2K1KHJ7_PHYPA|nr:uncharacterized protein LOC112283416 isoform X2 [Physcomitrium patens]PNR53254.1 hypothetical protein PHYPA_009630 [Physcomitrium patens]|eukprot:XP_024377815.1 uncharacterized protein LOC112283416 isoform X2 [Physcomitrella patens]